MVSDGCPERKPSLSTMALRDPLSDRCSNRSRHPCTKKVSKRCPEREATQLPNLLTRTDMASSWQCVARAPWEPALLLATCWPCLRAVQGLTRGDRWGRSRRRCETKRGGKTQRSLSSHGWSTFDVRFAPIDGKDENQSQRTGATALRTLGEGGLLTGRTEIAQS